MSKSGQKGSRKIGRWKRSPYGIRYTATWRSRKRARILRHLKRFDIGGTDDRSREALRRLSD